MNDARPRRRVWWFLLTVFLAAAATVVILNLQGSEKEIRKRVTHRFGVRSEQFVRELGTLLGPPIIGGNAVEPLQNGVEIFPAILRELRGANETINFETYIYWSGSVGRLVAETLAERARAGVKVRLLLDWAGSQKMEKQLVRYMHRSGVQIRYFRPLHWYHLGRLNHRTHRKLIIVDGRVAFTGGVGIADPWDGNAHDSRHWRDSHYRIQGPVVAQIQAAFADNWIKTTGEVLSGERYFPPLASEGEVPAQMFISSPEGGGESMQLMYLLAIASSERTIDLAAAYFVPDALTRRVVVDALKRGVRVRILVPGPFTDSKVVTQASRANWDELLRNGAEFYRYQPAMLHTKLLVVDSLLVSVGSTNFDNRSFRLNDEANLNLYDAALAAKLTQVFERDLARSKPFTLSDWHARSWKEKCIDELSALLSSQL